MNKDPLFPFLGDSMRVADIMPVLPDSTLKAFQAMSDSIAGVQFAKSVMPSTIGLLGLDKATLDISKTIAGMNVDTLGTLKNLGIGAAFAGRAITGLSSIAANGEAIAAAAEAIVDRVRDADLPQPAPSPQPKTVKLYVRMTADRKENERILSFRIPDGIDAFDLLDHGYAIDGNQALFTIEPAKDDDGQTVYDTALADVWESSFTKALAAEQKALVTYLRERGFAPVFA